MGQWRGDTKQHWGTWSLCRYQGTSTERKLGGFPVGAHPGPPLPALAHPGPSTQGSESKEAELDAPARI